LSLIKCGVFHETYRLFILLIILDVSGCCLENLVSYMYSGILRLTPDNVNIMLLVATQLEISTVVELCQNYIANPHYRDASGEKEHTDCNSRDITEDCQVDDVVHMPAVKVEKENSADGYLFTLHVGPATASIRTTWSSSRKLQATESSQVIKSSLTSSHEQTVIDGNSFGCRKRINTTETSSEPLPLKKSVSVVSTSTNEGDDPDWKPSMDSDSRSPFHRYNTRKHSRPALCKSLSSTDVCNRNVHPKHLLSSTVGNHLLQIAQKNPASATKNRSMTSTAIYCLPAWRQARRILLAAKVFLAKHIKVTDDGLLNCQLCQVEAFTSRSHLAAHVLHRHEWQHFCLSCSRQFVSFLALVRHRKSKHRYFPDACSPTSWLKKESVKSPSSLSTTAASLHNKCGWCGLKFDARSELVEHRETVHRKRTDVASTPACRRVVRDWNCREKDCGMTFKHKDKLRLHMAEHHPTVVFTCPECRFKTQVEQILQRYLATLYTTELRKGVIFDGINIFAVDEQSDFDYSMYIET